MKILHPIVQSIYPPLCRGCQTLITSEEIFCATCTTHLKPLPSLILPITSHYKLTVFAAAPYTYPARTLVTRKFSGDVVAARQLARLILMYTPLRTHPIDYLVPIPLHWTRYAQRGFNQAYEMAYTIGHDIKKPVARLIRRQRTTVFQWKLSGKNRQENVKDAFALSLKYSLFKNLDIRDRHIVLIDDLCTTGATLMQASRILAHYHPASITAFVGCRAI
ncbi:MAG: phosphoribosyltransferase family protein [Candidatus Babeliales bacterium]|jgi:ComF family protein